MSDDPDAPYEMTPEEQARWAEVARVEQALYDALEPAALEALGARAHDLRGVVNERTRVIEASVAVSLRRIADSLESLDTVITWAVDGDDNANPHSLLKPLWAIAERLRGIGA